MNMTPNPSDDRETLDKIIEQNLPRDVLDPEVVAHVLSYYILSAGFSRGADAGIEAERDRYRALLVEIRDDLDSDPEDDAPDWMHLTVRSIDRALSAPPAPTSACPDCHGDPGHESGGPGGWIPGECDTCGKGKKPTSDAKGEAR